MKKTRPGRDRHYEVMDRTRTSKSGTDHNFEVVDMTVLVTGSPPCLLQEDPQGETLSRGGRLPWGGLGAAEPPRCPCPSGLCGVTWTLPPTVTVAGAMVIFNE